MLKKIGISLSALIIAIFVLPAIADPAAPADTNATAVQTKPVVPSAPAASPTIKKHHSQKRLAYDKRETWRIQNHEQKKQEKADETKKKNYTK